MRIVLTLSACALFCSVTAAQQFPVYSPSYALSQPNSNNIWPHATSPMRYMQIHDAWTFTSTGRTLIRGIAYRPSNDQFGYNKAAGSTEVMIRIGEAPTGVTSQTPAGTFDGNFETATVKTAFSRKIVNYPNSGSTAAELRIFDIAFPFDSPTFFLWNGSGTRSMTIETRCYSYTTGYPFDFVSSTTVKGYGYTIENGTYAGCKNNAGKIVEHEVQADKLYVASPNATIIGRSFLPTTPSIVSIGATRLNVQIPNTSCYLVNDPLIMLGGVTDAAGTLTFTFPLPNDPNLHRVSFLSQMVFIDPAANGPGLVTSQGWENGIGAGALVNDLGIIRMKTSGSPDTVTAITNTYKNGLVMQFNP
ncbi:MAG: hypothetical protein H6832_01795 [Planctomycetes bacterium]|nr:hypothetical protein [Planctomycetota bacterium]